jgi:cytochrome c peroxidase
VLVGGVLAACRAESAAPAADDAARPDAPVESTSAVQPEDGWGIFSADELRLVLQHSPLPEPPPDPTNAWADRTDAARLGQALFFDRRLSADGSVSCSTCHDPERAFTDGRSLSVGLVEGRRHTPTLLNAAYHRWQFWDGRADSLWAQALEPLESPAEHGTSRLAILHVIGRDPDLRGAYEATFGALPPLADGTRFPADGRPVDGHPDDPLDVAWRSMTDADRAAANRAFVNVGKAIAAYVRRLVSPGSAFDRFASAVRRNDADGASVLSDAAQRGLRTFVGKGGCRLCHSGPELTDREFHDTRVPLLVGSRAIDPGRYAGVSAVRANPFNGASEYSDARDGPARDKVERLVTSGASWGEFKTPTLRNVARTAPYMHQGQFATLEEVVRFYSTLEGALPSHDHGETTMLPLDLSEQEIDDLVAFLRSLTDEGLDPELLRAPAELPR